MCEYCSLFFATMGLVLSIIIYERSLDEIAPIHIYNMTCSFFLAISIYTRYDIWLAWSKSIQKYTMYDNLINTGLYKNMLCEIVINVIAPYSFLKGIVYKEKMKFDEEITI
mmetsp:Transcript_35663/g.54567  ORF Transcript_35663/g.54567 Transcript_35663/m.54567 type:complete len:111 (+) Transcript_35663:568-900(+)